MLKYAHEHGCPWGFLVSADWDPGLGMLEHALKNGCTINEIICTHASKNNNLEMLKYAR